MYRIPKGTSAAEIKIAARFPGRGQFPRGCQADPAEAMVWLRQYAEEGNPEAQTLLKRYEENTP